MAEQVLGAIASVVSIIGGVATVVSAVKVSSRGNAKSAVEYDVNDRDADVYLFTSRLSPFPDSTEFHHWAIVICFEGNDFRTIEGLVDEETKLYAVYSKVHPKEDGKYYHLGKIHTSPKKVLDMCQSNQYNLVEYLPTWQNCQSWVKDLAKKLGDIISSALEKYPTLMEAKPLFAAIGKCATRSSHFSSYPSQKMFNSSKAASGPKQNQHIE